jgi:hypothetical protein
VCRTRTAKLTIVNGGKPLEVRGASMRLLGADIAPSAGTRRLAVRVRLRNTDAVPHRFNVGRRQIYLVIGPRQIRAARLKHRRPGILDGKRRALQPGEAENGTVYFDLDAGALRRLRRADGRADLGFVPFGELGTSRPDTIGVIQMRLDA